MPKFWIPHQKKKSFLARERPFSQKAFHLPSETDLSGSIIQICLDAQHPIVYCLSASHLGDYPGRLIKTLQKKREEQNL